MNKRLLIITSSSQRTVSWKERETFVRDFCTKLEEQLDNISVGYSTYEDLQFKVIGNKTSITELKSGSALDDFDLIYFKNWSYEKEEATLAAYFLKKHSALFFNAEVGESSKNDKLNQMFRLADGGLPVPDTFYVNRKLLTGVFNSNKLPEGFTYPIVMKAIDGSRGDDNYLLNSPEEALKILKEVDPEKKFILQNYIANDGDYRFLFIGIDDSPLVFLRQAVSGQHLNNTSKGGTGQFVDLKTLPSDYLDLAQKAATIAQTEISGVDILVDKQSNKPYILEVNGTPAVATGYGTDQKLLKMARFVKSQLDEREEE